MQFGYDFKRSNNDLEFGGFQVFNSNTHIHQFVVNYEISRTDARGQGRANAMVVLSPGRLDGDNQDAAFDAARHGATPRYAYLQLSAQRDVTFGRRFLGFCARHFSVDARYVAAQRRTRPRWRQQCARL